MLDRFIVAPCVFFAKTGVVCIVTGLFILGCSDGGGDPSDGSDGGSAASGGKGTASGGVATGGASSGGSSASGGNGGSAGTNGSGGTESASGGSAGSMGSGGNGGSGGSNIVHPPNPCVEAGTCPPGTWVDVTPAEAMPLPEYGAQDVVADPVRPNDLYAFICYRGVWKSTDYGMTWEHVSTGMNSDHLESGRPWGAAIDPNGARDAETPPTLYTAAGYGNQLGIYKSTDGGVNWANYALNNTEGTTSNDVYSMDIDPYDSQHLIAGFHDVGLSESTDGGETWTTVDVPANFGSSVFAWFVLTGSETTSSTWITQAQWVNNSNGMWRTTNAGASWDHVQDKLEHGHGSSQIYQDGQGKMYASGAAAGSGVIFRSTDYGVTWAAASNGGVGQNNVFGTPNYVYATLPGAVTGEQGQHLQRSPATDGVTWEDWAPIAPEGMTNGAKRAAVTYDGEHYVIVTGNWNAGIWRYVE